MTKKIVRILKGTQNTNRALTTIMSRYLNDLGAPHTPAIVNLSVAHEFRSTAHFRYIAGSSIADEFRRTRATYSRDLVQKIRAHGE